MRAAQREREGYPSFRCASIAMEGRGVPAGPPIGATEARSSRLAQIGASRTSQSAFPLWGCFAALGALGVRSVTVLPRPASPKEVGSARSEASGSPRPEGG